MKLVFFENLQSASKLINSLMLPETGLKYLEIAKEVLTDKIRISYKTKDD